MTLLKHMDAVGFSLTEIPKANSKFQVEVTVKDPTTTAPNKCTVSFVMGTKTTLDMSVLPRTGSIPENHRTNLPRLLTTITVTGTTSVADISMVLDGVSTNPGLELLKTAGKSEVSNAYFFIFRNCTV